VVDLIVHKNTTHLLMESLGDNLESIKRKQADKRLNKLAVSQVGLEVSLALEQLHAIGLLHRDLKPQNMALDRWHRIKLIDYGLS
jgi:serine/threonine protein kinase